MADITVQKISGGTVSLSSSAALWTALAPAAAAAAAAGDTIPNDGRTFLEVINGAASSITVTITQAKKSSYGEDHDPTVSVTNGTTKFIGPFEKDRFDDANCKVQIAYSSTATITVRAYSLAEKFSSN